MPSTLDNPVDQLGEGIRAGLFDADLDRLARAIDARRAVITSERVASGQAGVQPRTLRDAPVGSRFKINPAAPIGPKYLLGLPGQVKSHRQKHVIFAFDCGPLGKYRRGEIIMPLEHLRSL